MPGIVCPPGMPVGLPHDCSHPVIVLISGSCAALICAASCLTCGSVARVPARLAISTACWWCGIIPWANITSASLNEPGALPAVAEEPPFMLPMLPVSWPPLLLSLLLPHAVASRAAPSRAADMRARRRDRRMRVIADGSPFERVGMSGTACPRRPGTTPMGDRSSGNLHQPQRLRCGRTRPRHAEEWHARCRSAVPCQVGEGGPHQRVLASVAELLARRRAYAERASGPDGRRAAGFQLVIAAAAVARTPGTPLPGNTAVR